MPETISNPLNVLAPSEDWRLEPSETALLTVDVQYLDAHPDFGIGREAKKRGIEREFTYYWAQLGAVVPQIQRLQDACRACGIEVIHLRIASLTGDCRDSSRGHHIRGLLAPPDSREAQFLEAVAPVGDEIVITKTSSSPFSSTAVDQVLRNLGVRSLLVCGVVTNGCVDMTVRDAADRNYGVIVVHDACAAMSDELHQMGLRTMDGFMGLVRLRSVAEVLELLGRTGGAAPAALDARR